MTYFEAGLWISWFVSWELKFILLTDFFSFDWEAFSTLVVKSFYGCFWVWFFVVEFDFKLISDSLRILISIGRLIFSVLLFWQCKGSFLFSFSLKDAFIGVKGLSLLNQLVISFTKSSTKLKEVGSFQYIISIDSSL